MPMARKDELVLEWQAISRPAFEVPPLASPFPTSGYILFATTVPEKDQKDDVHQPIRLSSHRVDGTLLFFVDDVVLVP